MPSLGYEVPILLAQKAVFRNASPAQKLTPRGFLEFLLNNNRPQVLQSTINPDSGYIRDVKIRLRKRMGLGKTVTTDDCSIQGLPEFFEQGIPSTLFRKYAVFFPWSMIEKFTEDALRIVNLPNSQPNTPVMQEVIDTFTSKFNGILGDINSDLLTLQAANFGKNIASGNNAARTLNIPLINNQNNLSEGFTMLLNDAMQNEIRPELGGMAIVGSGLINNFMLKQTFDATKAPTLPQFYYDPMTTTKWGADQFGVFDRDAVQFINICRFKGGAKSGRFGTSRFGTVKWPIIDSFGNAGLSNLEFDFQVREIDCPTPDMVIDGTPTSVSRGLVFDLMCSYQMMSLGADSFAADDVLFGTNGALRYKMTNVDSSAAPVV